MSVIMTMRVSGDPARFEETVAAKADAIGRIMDVAKRNGLIAHRWYGSKGGEARLGRTGSRTVSGARRHWDP